MSTHHLCAKGHQCQSGHFKALGTNGNADDRDAPHQSQHPVAHGHLPAEEQQPQQVGPKGHAAASVYDLLAEGEEGKAGKLEALGTQRDADDGDAEDAPGQRPRQSADQSAEQEPENDANGLHRSSNLAYQTNCAPDRDAAVASMHLL